MTTTWEIREGDCREVLATLPERSVHTVVTSPPYFGLRDYGTGEGQIGLEATVDEFVAALVAVFREVRRVLRDDGTVWLNLGDSYACGGNGARDPERWPKQSRNNGGDRVQHAKRQTGAKAKDLLGVPWMVAFALRADGWYLRRDIIWSKPNPMPESVTDRPTTAHEYLFLLSKSGDPTFWTHRDGAGSRTKPKPDFRWIDRATGEEVDSEPHGFAVKERLADGRHRWQRINLWSAHDYYYDADAIREAWADERNGASGATASKYDDPGAMRQDGGVTQVPTVAGRNKRSVWTVATQPYSGAHFATFPPKLIEPCVLAGAPERACGTCGAPWVHVVERTAMEVRPGPSRDERRAAAVGAESRRAVNGTMTKAPTSRTVGFKPSCDHDDASAAGVVLDPCAGAGTTGLVALRHGRSFIGIELSPKYAEMARKRIRSDQPLFNSQSEVAAAETDAAGQAELFDEAAA